MATPSDLREIADTLMSGQSLADGAPHWPATADLLRTAADRWERLRAENAELTVERDNLALMVRRLLASTRPNPTLHQQAYGLLDRYGLLGSPLRHDKPEA